MSLGFSRCGWWLLLAWFAASGLVESSLRAQGKPQPRRSIELSETNSAEILTNLNQLTAKKDGFRTLEDQLKSLKGVISPNLMESDFSVPYTAPSASPRSSKAIKELIDRKNNWGLSAAELGMTSGSLDPDSLSVFGDDKSDNKQNSLKQFYDSLNRQSGGAQNSGGTKDTRSTLSRVEPVFKSDTTSDDSNLPPGIKENLQSLKDAVKRDPTSIFNPERAHTSFENFFGTDYGVAHDQETTRKTSMESFVEQFKRGLESPSAAANLSPTLSALVPKDASGRAVITPSSQPFSSGAHKDLVDPTPGNINTRADKTTLPDITSAVLNQWNPLYTPPKLELPKVTPPTPPSLDFPRRRF